jgi:hypothetical protein
MLTAHERSIQTIELELAVQGQCGDAGKEERTFIFIPSSIHHHPLPTGSSVDDVQYSPDAEVLSEARYGCILSVCKAPVCTKY